MKQGYLNRKKELLDLSGLIGESHKRITDELLVLEKLMWLLIYNAGENYTGELKAQLEKSKRNKSEQEVVNATQTL